MNYYKILQVDSEAEREVIQAAYRRLARKYHPDGTSPDVAKMRQINEAYEVLSDPITRAQYDRKHEQPPKATSDETRTPPKSDFQPKREAPKPRKHSFLKGKLLAFVIGTIVIVGGSFLTWLDEIVLQPQLPARTISGLETEFTRMGYSFQPHTDESGLGGRAGTIDDGITWIFLMGSGDGIDYVSFTTTLYEGRVDTQFGYFVDFLTVVLGDASHALTISKWMAEHSEIGQTDSVSRKFGRYDVVLEAKPEDGWFTLWLFD